MRFDHESKLKQRIITALIVVFGIVVLHNQRLSMTDPENTYPKKIRRAIRLFFNPPENALQSHLIGKGIACDDSNQLYINVASATVVIRADQAVGAGVFIGPRLIVTAKHVVDGKHIDVILPRVSEENLAEPGNSIEIQSIFRSQDLDLAFIKTASSYQFWLNLETEFTDDPNLMVVGHPNRKYYSLQKGRIKKKRMLKSSDFIIFKNNEIFFGNSGGAIVACNGKLAGVVSMMSNYDNSRLKQGIGINSPTIQKYLKMFKLG